MSRGVLAGLGSKDYKQAVEGLMSQGWSVEKTNGNHLRLEHPDASQPVFASCTPNLSPRSIKNMEAQCKRALRPAQVLPAPAVQKQEETIDMTSRSRKRRKPRHSEIMGMGPLSLAKPLLGGTDAVATRSGFDLPSGKAATSAAALGAAAPIKAPQPVAPQKAPSPAKPDAPTTEISAINENKMNTDTDPVTEATEQDSTMIPLTKNHVVDPVREGADTGKLVALVAPDAAMASTPAQDSSNQEKAFSAEPVHADAALLETLMQIQRGEHDRLMALAARIHRGELKPITVTADMVGATIWVSSDAVVAGTPATPATAVVADNPGAAPTIAKARAQNVLPEASEERLNKLLPHLTGEWQSLNVILGLAGLGGASQSEKQLYRTAIRRAAEANLVDRLDAAHGNAKYYRKLG